MAFRFTAEPQACSCLCFMFLAEKVNISVHFALQYFNQSLIFFIPGSDNHHCQEFFCVFACAESFILFTMAKFLWDGIRMLPVNNSGELLRLNADGGGLPYGTPSPGATG